MSVIEPFDLRTLRERSRAAGMAYVAARNNLLADIASRWYYKSQLLGKNHRHYCELYDCWGSLVWTIRQANLWADYAFVARCQGLEKILKFETYAELLQTLFSRRQESTREQTPISFKAGGFSDE